MNDQQKKISGDYKVTYKQKEGAESDYMFSRPIPALQVVIEKAIAKVKEREANASED